MEQEIQRVMQETGMDRLQAYYRVKARRTIVKSAEFRRASLSNLIK